MIGTTRIIRHISWWKVLQANPLIGGSTDRGARKNSSNVTTLLWRSTSFQTLEFARVPGLRDARLRIRIRRLDVSGSVTMAGNQSTCHNNIGKHIAEASFVRVRYHAIGGALSVIGAPNITRWHRRTDGIGCASVKVDTIRTIGQRRRHSDTLLCISE